MFIQKFDITFEVLGYFLNFRRKSWDHTWNVRISLEISFEMLISKMKCQNYVWIIVWKFKIILEIWGSSDNFQYWNEIKCSSCINRENLDVHLVWKFVYHAGNILYQLFICSWNFKIGIRTRDFLWMNNGWTYVNLCSKNVYRLQKFVDQVSIKNKKFNISKNKMFIKRKKKYYKNYNVHI